MTLIKSYRLSRTFMNKEFVQINDNIQQSLLHAMQLLFSFDRGMRVKKTLMQNPSSRLNGCFKAFPQSSLYQYTLARHFLSCKSAVAS